MNIGKLRVHLSPFQNKKAQPKPRRQRISLPGAEGASA